MHHAARRPAFGRLLAAKCRTAVNSQCSEFYGKRKFKLSLAWQSNIFPTQKKVVNITWRDLPVIYCHEIYAIHLLSMLKTNRFMTDRRMR